MKAQKSDAIFDISSDFYINGPQVLIHHLTLLIKMFLVHGILPRTLLLCSLLPLVKDGLGDITASENYCAISEGSVMLKWIDQVILHLESDNLGFYVM